MRTCWVCVGFFWVYVREPPLLYARFGAVAPILIASKIDWLSSGCSQFYIVSTWICIPLFMGSVYFDAWYVGPVWYARLAIAIPCCVSHCAHLRPGFLFGLFDSSSRPELFQRRTVSRPTVICCPNSMRSFQKNRSQRLWQKMATHLKSMWVEPTKMNHKYRINRHCAERYSTA